MNRSIVSLLALSLLVACQDSRLGDAPILGPSFHISEGRFGGGNADFFFATPLATTPQPGDPNFDVGASNSVLVPFVRVCETDGVPNTLGCVTDVTQQVTGSPTGLAMSYEPQAELYQVQWQTGALREDKDYRIEIWGISFTTSAEKAALDPRWLFGWRDVRHSPNATTCDGTEPFCLIRYGQTLPVRVRIEQFVFCPLTKNCAVQFIAAGQDANLEAQLPATAAAPSAQLFIPGQAGTNFALAFEPCSTAEDAAVSAAIDVPTFGPCLKTVTAFTGTLAIPAIISLCDQLDPTGFGLSQSQEQQLALHHFSNDLSRIQALPEAWQCTASTSGGIVSVAPHGALQVARAIGQRVLNWVMPKPLFATAAMIDRGGGGQSPEFSSFFKLALPGKFVYEQPSDAQQTGVAGLRIELRAKVTDLFGAAVRNARVRWKAITPPADGATVQGIVPAPITTLTDGEGLARKSVELSVTPGVNVFHAFGRGIADDRGSVCIEPPSTLAPCNGPRSSFDPFIPIHVPEFDDVGQELPVELAVGTRLRFAVEGCRAGLGTAAVDGVFSPAEWACAKTYPFNAKVAGGSTPATLYVMNDGASLYLAVRLQRKVTDKVNTLQINFDNNDSWVSTRTGTAESGDGVVSLDGVLGFTDAYLTTTCTNSSQSSCWASDASDAGTNDGSGRVKNDGVYTTYEISHPLNTADDRHDYSLAAGAKVGLFLTLQTGSGAAGNTQWPGFRKYVEVKIEQ